MKDNSYKWTPAGIGMVSAAVLLLIVFAYQWYSCKKGRKKETVMSSTTVPQNVDKTPEENPPDHHAQLHNNLENGEQPSPSSAPVSQTGSQNQVSSIPEQIKQLKELLDAGALTQAEFDSKK